MKWMKDYAVRRPEILRKQMVEYFNLIGESTNVNVIAPVGGKIRVNSLSYSSNWKGVYLENLPIHVEAIPDEGYVFVRWKGRKFPKSNKGRVFPRKAKKVRAIFKPIRK